MKTEAQKLYTAFQNIECCDNGFLKTSQLRFWLKQVRSRAVDEVCCCPSSSDSSFICSFEDGSCIYVANPAQEAFRSFCRVEGV